jgi:hypothetical protein
MPTWAANTSPSSKQTIRDNQTPYYLNLHWNDVPHTLILGATGTGKTQCLCNSGYTKPARAEDSIRSRSWSRRSDFRYFSVVAMFLCPSMTCRLQISTD